MGCARWLVGMGMIAITALAGCNDEEPTPDADAEVDADVEVDADADLGNFPPFDCVMDDDLNMTTCMLPNPDPDAGTEWGTWCDGDCRPVCSTPPNECPSELTCHRHGVSYLCFPPD
jgi:hypothetical protein